MKSSRGVEIESIGKGSIAAKAGLLPGDRLVAINGHEIRDVIDLMFYANEPDLKFRVVRDDVRMAFDAGLEDDGPADLGIMLKPFKIKTCRNNCIFCFVLQLPKGLRRTLYVKDEDYRMSFLFGNYITLTNLSEADKKRIVEQRLGPLYISVHSMDTTTRNRMIGKPDAEDIVKGIKFFADNRIRMHVQIVLCPGHNDGRLLHRTLTALYRFYPYVMSIAVVPVGLTMHRRKIIRPVEKEDAVRALDTIAKFQSRFRKKHGEHIVFASDEMYIRAGAVFPPLKDYDDLPQIENGVGLVPLFMHQAKKIKLPQAADKVKHRRFVAVTGMSFYPYLSKFTDKLKKSGVDIELVAVGNSFFGHNVTVTGLLTGRDVMKALSGFVKQDDILLIPDIVMREGDEVFLDDVSKKDVEDVLGVKAVIIESTPQGLVEAIMELS